MRNDLKYTTRLVEIRDDDFEWMIRNDASIRHGLRLPPGGVDDVSVLALLRRSAARLRDQQCNDAWMMVSDDEVVGLCSYRRPPAQGEAEIGYGVAPSRRNRGHATRAVGLIVSIASRDGLGTLVAETAVDNAASIAVVKRNGFVPILRRIDVEDGEVQRWRRRLTS